MPQNAGTSNYAFIVRSDGEVNSIYVKNTDVVRPVLYLTSSVEIIGGNGTSTEPYVLGMPQKDTSGASAPVLASNMIPVYYDEANSVWKKADKNNSQKDYRWYSYTSTGEYKGMGFFP